MTGDYFVFKKVQVFDTCYNGYAPLKSIKSKEWRWISFFLFAGAHKHETLSAKILLGNRRSGENGLMFLAIKDKKDILVAIFNLLQN